MLHWPGVRSLGCPREALAVSRHSSLEPECAHQCAVHLLLYI